MKEITLFKKTYRYGLRVCMLMVFILADIDMVVKLYFVKDASDALLIVTFMILYAICVFLIYTFVGSKRIVTYNQENKEVIVKNSNKDRINGRIIKCHVSDIVGLKVITVAEYLKKYRQDLTYDIEVKQGNEPYIYIGMLELKNKKSIVIIEDGKSSVTIRMNKVKELLKVN